MRSLDQPPSPTMSLERIELLHALEHDGCPLCWITSRASRRYLYHVLHEYVLDGGLRVKLRHARGFCRDHAWALQRLEEEVWHDGMGTATLYEDLARAVARTIRDHPPAADRPKKRLFRSSSDDISPIARALEPVGQCPACAAAQFKEDYMADVLVRMLEYDAEVREKFVGSFGLCVPHFLGALEACSAEGVRQLLVDVEATKLEALAGELEDYTRKHSVGHHHEPKGREQTSWIRVIEQFAGKPGC